MRSARRTRDVALRIALAIGGGYVASAAIVAGFAIVATASGMMHSEAVVLGSMLGFIVYLVLLLWGFAERRLWRFAVALTLCAFSGFAVASLTGPAG